MFVYKYYCHIYFTNLGDGDYGIKLQASKATGKS